MLFGREVIDTAANRASMPGADSSRWTPLPVLADYVWGMLANPPPTGALITVVTRSGDTHFDQI